MGKCKYNTHVKPYLKKIEKWCQNMTEEQIAKNKLHIAYSTWCEYKKKFPEISEALKKGRKEELVPGLRSTLIKRARGYKFKELKVIVEERDLPKELQELLIEQGFNPRDFRKVIRKEMNYKHMPPDVAAINLALKNYDKDNWANDPQMLEIKKEELRIKKSEAWLDD